MNVDTAKGLTPIWHSLLAHFVWVDDERETFASFIFQGVKMSFDMPNEASTKW